MTEDTIYYRAGDAHNKYGRYFVETPPKSVIQVRMDTAVKPYWTNNRTGMWEKNDLGIDISGKSKIEKMYTVRVPAGTVIYEVQLHHKVGCIWEEWRQIRYLYPILEYLELNFLNMLNRIH